MSRPLNGDFNGEIPMPPQSIDEIFNSIIETAIEAESNLPPKPPDDQSEWKDHAKRVLWPIYNDEKAIRAYFAHVLTNNSVRPFVKDISRRLYPLVRGG